MILPPTAAVETFVETLSRLDGLLLTGGGDVCPAMYGEKRGPGLKDMDPQRDACETAALREARKRGLPVLGICRGIQIMAVAFGGTLYRDLPSEKEGASGHWQQMPRARHSHHVRVTRGSRLFRILEDVFVPVNSHHHQAVKTVPPGFTASASAEDGLVEALEDPVHPFSLPSSGIPREPSTGMPHRGKFLKPLFMRHEGRSHHENFIHVRPPRPEEPL